MSYRIIDFDWLNEIVAPAIDLFYMTPSDKDLIDRDVSERAIVANMYCKMKAEFQSKKANSQDLQSLCIDAEYNRNDEDTKKAYQKCTSCHQQDCYIKIHGFIETDMTPDILVHKRGTCEDNQIAIEFKKVSNKDINGRKSDNAKLTYMTCQQSFPNNEAKNLKYREGFFIDLCIDTYIVTTYRDAQIIDIRKRGKVFGLYEWVD